MNYIGHLAVALWQRSDPRFVLGSMLPDFAGMIGARLCAADDPELAAGIALHHRTDAVFHAAGAFTSLLHGMRDTLTSRGVPRGTARAVGHIAVEMLIDGELLREPVLGDAYTTALRAGASTEAPFTDSDGEARFQALRARLLAHGAPHDYRDPEAILRRLVLALRGRPRLAIDAASTPIIASALPGLQRKVALALPGLLASVRDGLA